MGKLIDVNEFNPAARARAAKAEYDRRYFERYPEKRAGYLAIKNVKKEPGEHLHHWSYNHADLKDTISLSIPIHKFLHKHIVYDQERRKYRRYDNNVLLNTRGEHEDFIKELTK